MKKYFLIGAVALLGIIGLFLLFSPFKYDKKNAVYVLQNEITIEQPVDVVYNYLGNSNNASKWSVFVDHITPLNPEEHTDGEIGSSRRCFKNKNEKGIFWDETILDNIWLTERKLSIYNLNGFPVTTDNLVTFQKYECLSDGNTLLKFGLFKNEKEVNWLVWIKIKLAAYVVSTIFKRNLQGVKTQLEQQNDN